MKYPRTSFGSEVKQAAVKAGTYLRTGKERRAIKRSDEEFKALKAGNQIKPFTPDINNINPYDKNTQIYVRAQQVKAGIEKRNEIKNKKIEKTKSKFAPGSPRYDRQIRRANRMY